MFNITVPKNHPVTQAGCWICGVAVGDTNVRTGISDKTKKRWAMATTQIVCGTQFVRITESAPDGDDMKLKKWKHGETATFAISPDRADDGQLIVNGVSFIAQGAPAPVAA